MRRTRVCARLWTTVALTAAALAQTPRVELAFAADAATSGLPAITWLCGTVLPLRSEWPTGLVTGESFVARLSADGLSISANSVALPNGAIATGAVEFAPGKRALCMCSADGSEDWYIPRDAMPPANWVKLLQLLHAFDLDTTHTIDVAVAVGHLLGATPAGDNSREAIQLGAALCGEVTWRAWSNAEHIRVRGRSDGGLLLPAVLLVLARAEGNGEVSPFPLRAFVARDGDREEAVRQMSRGSDKFSRPALLAMLHGSDELRLTAIDSLVRLRASDELPRIVEAAEPSLPLATVAAVDAVAALWSHASDATRVKTRDALAASPSTVLRNLEPGRAAADTDPAANSPFPHHWRLLLGLFVLAAGLFGLWLRERARAVAFF